jgi:hypothetical protein
VETSTTLRLLAPSASHIKQHTTVRVACQAPFESRDWTAEGTRGRGPPHSKRLWDRLLNLTGRGVRQTAMGWPFVRHGD